MKEHGDAFKKIAIFVLSTTKPNGMYSKTFQDFPTYWESRILPIRNTWGSYFSDNLMFVFGTNTFDYRFLTEGNRCQQQQNLGDPNVKGRLLKAHNRQARSFNSSLHFKCSIQPHETYSHYLATKKKSSRAKTFSLTLSPTTSNSSEREEVSILYAGNCTGEYFGFGPVCRCQEAMRYFNAHLADRFEWFVFIDDDIFMRPVALLTMLHQIQPLSLWQLPSLLPRNSSLDAIGSQPVALVSSSRYRGFLGSKTVWKKQLQPPSSPSNLSSGEQQGALDCAVPHVHDFAFAQPAIINKAGMLRMRAAIQSNALTQLQRSWGGSHDFLLGLLLWLCDLPTYSFGRSYYGLELLRRPTQSGGLTPSAVAPVPIDLSRHVVFHRLLNFKKFQKAAGQPQGVAVKLAVAGIYDLVELLHEEELYLPRHTNAAATTDSSSSSFSSPNYTFPSGLDDLNRQNVQLQIAAGVAAANSLVRNKAGGVFRTIFAAKARDITERFAPFRPTDCILAVL